MRLRAAGGVHAGLASAEYQTAISGRVTYAPAAATAKHSAKHATNRTTEAI